MDELIPTSNSIFTIGHSNLDPTDFLGALGKHGVKILCDVRSRPASFRFPQFNREPLSVGLAAVKIQYEFLGETLGGRPSDARDYHEDGRADYLSRRRSPDFSNSLDRVVALSRLRVVALMCAEEDPLECHRFLMICPALLDRGITPLHIRRGGSLEAQRDAEDRLLELHGRTAFATGSLFVSEREIAIEEALQLQAKEFAFRASPEAIEYY